MELAERQYADGGNRCGSDYHLATTWLINANQHQLPKAGSCCLVYSYIAIAPLTCTFRDLITPN